MLPSSVNYINLLSDFFPKQDNFVISEGTLPTNNNEIFTSPIVNGKEYKTGDKVFYQNQSYTIVGIGGFYNTDTNEMYSDAVILPYDSTEYLKNVDNKKLLDSVIVDQVGEKKASSLYEPYGNLIVSYDLEHEQEFFDYLDENFKDSTIYSKNYNNSINKFSDYFTVIKENIVESSKLLYLTIGYTLIILLALIHMRNKEAKKLKLYHYSQKTIDKVNNLELISIYAMSSVLAIFIQSILLLQIFRIGIFIIALLLFMLVQFLIFKIYVFLVNKAFYD